MMGDDKGDWQEKRSFYDEIPNEMVFVETLLQCHDAMNYTIMKGCICLIDRYSAMTCEWFCLNAIRIKL